MYSLGFLSSKADPSMLVYHCKIFVVILLSMWTILSSLEVLRSSLMTWFQIYMIHSLFKILDLLVFFFLGVEVSNVASDSLFLSIKKYI